jgi:hypothetical protein
MDVPELPLEIVEYWQRPLLPPITQLHTVTM